MSYYGGWAPYVSVAKRRQNAAKKMKKLSKKGMKIEPIEIQGRKIAHTFWGKVWCEHLESFSDYENRLPRGRTYARNGSICHLSISKGKIEAIVSGSDLYNITVTIAALGASEWSDLKKRCAGKIGSILELLQGRFGDNVMLEVTDKKKGLLPKTKQIRFSCSCPDGASMCKHVAAVLYGVGARLDDQPEKLFLLRNVDHNELISVQLDVQSIASQKGTRRRLAQSDLSELFDVEMQKPTQPSFGSKSIPTKKAKKVPTKKIDRAPAIKTSSAVVRLRKKFKLTIPEFALLIGVSSATITNWEKRGGKLNLLQKNLDTLNKISSLDIVQVKQKLKGLET